MKAIKSLSLCQRNIENIALSIILMSLDEEMMGEIRKMEKEIAHIDEELEKLQARVLHLVGIRNKLAKDADVLKAYFSPQEKKEKQATLLGLMK